MDWCAAKTLLEMKSAALLKKLKTTAVEQYFIFLKNISGARAPVLHNTNRHWSIITCGKQHKMLNTY
jgi:hypothetical protein